MHYWLIVIGRYHENRNTISWMKFESQNYLFCLEIDEADDILIRLYLNADV